MSSGHRIVFIGDTEVGKTSIINRFIKKEFTDQNPTVGASYFTYMTSYKDKEILMQIWDTAGQENFRAIGPIYYRRAMAAVAVFDLTRKETLDNLNAWITDYRNYADDKFVIVVGNKQDLEDSITIELDETLEIARSMDAECIWASAKSGIGIEDIINLLAQHLYNVNEKEAEEKVVIHQEQCTPAKKSCC